MTEFYSDVLPKLLVELRDDDTVAEIVGTRVRGVEPAPDDVHGAGEYVAFIVLVELDTQRLSRVPVQTVQVAIRCYGRSHAEAARLRWAVSNALHLAGPRVHGSGLGIYTSLESGGGQQELDPVTRQPLQVLVIEALATTQAVAA